MWWRPSSEKRFRYAKYRDWFACLDRDRSGALDPRDASAYARWFQHHHGWQDDAPPYLAVVAAWQDFWRAFEGPMDEDTDGVIRIDEFVGFHATLSDEIGRTGETPAWAAGPVEALFRTLDLDGDGYITAQEYGLYLASIGSEADAAAAFATLDVDQDGQLDLSQIRALYTEWVTATSPEAVGNLLLTGRLPTL